MNQTLFLSQLRVIILVGIAYAAGKGWLSSGDSSAITSVLTPIGVIAGPWIWSIYSNINSKIVPQHAVVIDPITTAANADKPSATVQTSAGTVTGKVVSVLLVAFALSLFLAGGSAYAQTRKPAINLPIDPLHLNASASTTTSQGACDITMFTTLTVQNVVQTIKNCVGSVVAGGAKPFVDDITDALASATKANDGTAVACLTPALAIATAAEGTPAVVAADGTVTTPAKYPGPILIFQKYREFVNAGGPSNCKTAVQSTINGTVASAL